MARRVLQREGNTNAHLKKKEYEVSYFVKKKQSGVLA